MSADSTFIIFDYNNAVSGPYMWKMLVSDGSANWYKNAVIGRFYHNSFDGVQYDVGLSLDSSTNMHVKKIDMITGTEQWSNQFTCVNAPCTNEGSRVIIGSNNKVYSLISFKDSTVSTFGTVFDLTTGNVVGNRYLSPPNTLITMSLEEQDNFIYSIVVVNVVLLISKYDPSTDTFVGYRVSSYGYSANFKNGSGNK